VSVYAPLRENMM